MEAAYENWKRQEECGNALADAIENLARVVFEYQGIRGIGMFGDTSAKYRETRELLENRCAAGIQEAMQKLQMENL